MVKLAREAGNTRNPEFSRIMKQLGRELLLAQSSDWQFLISTWAARDYAQSRFSIHHERFTKLAEMAERAVRGETLPEENWNYLKKLEEADQVFPHLEPSLWE